VFGTQHGSVSGGDAVAVSVEGLQSKALIVGDE
jgi:hypothetical protein